MENGDLFRWWIIVKTCFEERVENIFCFIYPKSMILFSRIPVLKFLKCGVAFADMAWLNGTGSGGDCSWSNYAK